MSARGVVAEVVGSSPGALEIRPVPSLDINAAVHRAIDSVVPLTAHAAVVATADLNGVKLAVMLKKGEHWSFSGYLEKPWSGGLVAGAQVVFFA